MQNIEIAKGSKMRDFEEDLKQLFGDEIKNNDDLCKSVWCALAGIIWRNDDGEEFSATFRYAGSLIASIRGDGGYMDWYCSGPHETVSDEIADGLLSVGWTPHSHEETHVN